MQNWIPQTEEHRWQEAVERGALALAVLFALYIWGYIIVAVGAHRQKLLDLLEDRR